MLFHLSGEFNQFNEESIRSRLIRGVMGLVQNDAALGGPSAVCRVPTPMPPAEGVDDASQGIAEVAGALDNGELFTGVATSARTALSLFDAHVDWASGINDLEDEHGRDAIVRLVGLGLVAEGLCEGDSDASAALFLSTESGRAALAWFAAVDITVAFSTEDDPIDEDKVIDLLDAFFDDAIEAWSELSNERSLARARIIVNNWTDFLGPAVNASVPQGAAIAEAIRGALGSENLDADGLVAEAQRVGLYRSLVARHVGELLHGPCVEGAEAAAPDDASDQRDLSSALADERSRLALAQAQRAACADALDGLGAKASAAAAATQGHQRRRDELQASLKELKNQRSARAKSAGKHAERIDRLMGERERVAGALLEAQGAAAAAVQGRDARTGTSSSVDSGAVRLALLSELSAVRSVLDELNKGLGWRRSVQSSSETAFASVTEHQAALETTGVAAKVALASLKQERRGASRAKTATDGQRKKLTAKLETALDAVETAKRLARERRDRVEPFAKSIKSLTEKQRKRDNRCRDLAERAKESEAELTELSGTIAALRESLGASADRIAALRASDAEERRALREDVSLDLVRARKRLEALLAAIDPARDTLLTVTERAQEATGRADAEREKAEESGRAVQQLRHLHAEHSLDKKKAGKLAKAAHDMLKNCAGRLSDAHALLRAAQSSADGLLKEHRLRTGRLTDADKTIDAATAAASQAEQEIATVTAGIGSLRAALERNAANQDEARVRLAQAQADRAKEIRGSIADLRAHSGVLRERIAEAHEDKTGLAVAERKAVEARVKTIAGRETVRARLDTLRGQRAQAQQERKKRTEALAVVETRVSDAMAALIGARLLRDGCSGERDRRVGVASLSVERMGVLASAMAAAKSQEDDCVEAVADAQAWVEKSEGKLAKINEEQKRLKRALKSAQATARIRDATRPAKVRSAPRVTSKGRSAPLPPPPAAPPPSKLDNLLKKVAANPGHVEEVPDPSAAPDVDGLRTLVLRRPTPPALEVDAEAEMATQIFQRGGGEGEASTEMFSPEDLLARLAEEADEDATVMMPVTRRRPVRSRSSDEED